jgi:hypothetical protein
MWLDRSYGSPRQKRRELNYVGTEVVAWRCMNYEGFDFKNPDYTAVFKQRLKTFTINYARTPNASRR